MNQQRSMKIPTTNKHDSVDSETFFLSAYITNEPGSIYTNREKNCEEENPVSMKIGKNLG
jgi:hypothetical protein